MAIFLRCICQVMMTNSFSPLANKRILLGISGGIAAYKCAPLTRLLTECGAQVKVVMTKAAQAFITPLTMQALSGHPVADDEFSARAHSGMSHIELAKWADFILVAPATADIIARITAGMGDDLLTTLILASPAPLAIAPAMNQQMYQAAATQANLATLTARHTLIFGPASGEQACGDVGPGRMLEPEQLVQHVSDYFANLETKIEAKKTHSNELSGLSFLITAGPTQEAIDPVRFLSNHSSGKMGFAIAQAAARYGAQVTLISGPVQLATPENVTRINVVSAQQMQQKVLEHTASHHIFISCAAVADFRVKTVATQKIKKSADEQELQLTLIKNPDIVAAVANLPKNRPFTVGFAAETQNIEQYAKQKLLSKNLDLICANDVANGQVFNEDDNALHLYWPHGDKKLPRSSKIELAEKLVCEINALYQKQLNALQK
ncbi:MAG: bifunctional phosphopantothenoylcysteine decarboxylase/phosphopantothenate--cysteine ligase CoaBC [Vibrionaceae bacterium]